MVAAAVAAGGVLRMMIQLGAGASSWKHAHLVVLRPHHATSRHVTVRTRQRPAVVDGVWSLLENRLDETEKVHVISIFKLS